MPPNCSDTFSNKVKQNKLVFFCFEIFTKQWYPFNYETCEEDNFRNFQKHLNYRRVPHPGTIIITYNFYIWHLSYFSFWCFVSLLRFVFVNMGRKQQFKHSSRFYKTLKRKKKEFEIQKEKISEKIKPQPDFSISDVPSTSGSTACKFFKK